MNPSLSKIYHLMKEESPVFIVGAPRSGTSILYRSLQLHSSFKPRSCQATSGVELTETNIFKNPFNTYSGSVQSNQFYMLDNSECFQRFLAEVAPIRRHQSLWLGRRTLHQALPKLRFVSPVLRGALWRNMQSDLLIQAFLYYSKLARGTARVVEKTPQHIEFLPEIKATFPRAKLLFMPRHPIDVFTSYRRRYQDSLKLNVDKAALKWLDLSPKTFCKKYRSYSQLALDEMANNPDQFLVVKYEDFIADTKLALTDIMGFLGEGYEDDCIPYEQKQPSVWQDDPHLFGGIKKKTKEWREFIHESEIEAIEHALADVMKQWGYPKYLGTSRTLVNAQSI
jgi:hypothetical protein